MAQSVKRHATISELLSQIVPKSGKSINHRKGNRMTIHPSLMTQYQYKCVSARECDVSPAFVTVFC